MIESLLQPQLHPVAQRQRHWRLQRALAGCWLLTAAGWMLYWLAARHWHFQLPGAPWIFLSLAVIAGLAQWRRLHRWAPDYHEIARQIEARHPDLHALLVTAVEQRPDATTGRLNFLQQEVVREAVAASRRHSWIEVVPTRRLFLTELIQWLGLLLLVSLITGLPVNAPTPRLTSQAAPAPSITVTPGDTELERGRALAILARFQGPVPSEAFLQISTHGEPVRPLPLSRSLSDPLFGVTLPDVRADLSYAVVYGDNTTRVYRVEVFDFPALQRADAEIHSPAYTGQEIQRIPDTRRVTAVEGSRIHLSLQLNKPVASARLWRPGAEPIPLQVETNRATAALRDYDLQRSGRYELQLIDYAGRTNRVPAGFVFEALSNRAPELKLVFPKGDQRVSPLQELSLQAEVWDDFGLKGYGVSWRLAGNDGVQEKTIALHPATIGRERQRFEYLVRLEDLQAVPDQLLSWYFWADDLGPDGQVRRTASDLHFAEVRPFEEIFRQGQASEAERRQQEQSQAGGAGDQAMKLADLQKQIISATWKLQRQQPTNLPVTAAYRRDSGVVLESQETALQQAGELQPARGNATVRTPALEAVTAAMERAVKFLKQSTNAAASLPGALEAEQSAYQALLRLAAREYEVAQNRNSSSGGGGGGGERNQAQLDQLDLKEARNRYESQSQATAQQSPAQREQLQVLNRLRELAQRQQDLNERLKELQAALQAAQTATEREELQRRLKRLRDEERSMLADMDEVRQRMQQPENQSTMAEARQALEESRSQVQRAAEALDQESVSQALTAGTRAERQLEELRDDFRKKTSSQFTEEMRQMRQNARELAEKQDQIGQQLKELNQEKGRSLTDGGRTSALTGQLQEQRAGLTNLLTEMRRVTEQAETVEPLLSRQLYETIRQTSQSEISEALTMSEELVRRSFLQEAAPFENRARAQTADLKRSVERAAESVLGDETESLKRAQQQLDAVIDQLGRELSSATRDDGTNNTKSARAPGENRGQENGSQTNAQASAGMSNRPVAQGGAPSPQGEQPGQGQGQGREPGSAGQAGRPAQQANGTDPGPSGDGPGANGREPGNQAGGRAPGAGQDGQAPGQSQPGEGQARNAGPTPGQSPTSQGQGAGGQDRNGQPGGRPDGNRGIIESALGENREGAGGGPGGPLTGSDFSRWEDSLRDVEEMLPEPALRSQVAEARSRAQAVRAEFKRHSRDPKWEMVRDEIARPLAEVRQRVAEELARRQSPDALVPIDRDPVPPRYSELVRRYYENLGRGTPPPPANDR